jgi:hypothetical protein
LLTSPGNGCAWQEDRNANQQVVAAVNEERRTLRVGGLATVIVLIAAGLVSLFYYRRTQLQNTRVYAAITRLHTGMLKQQQLIETLGSSPRRGAARSLRPGIRNSFSSKRRAKN